jgi:hypothetical protein
MKIEEFFHTMIRLQEDIISISSAAGGLVSLLLSVRVYVLGLDPRGLKMP